MRFRYKYKLLLILLYSSTANAVEVSRDSWVESMLTAIPSHFCQSEQYFRQCFTVSAEKCEEVAASSTRICIGKSKEQIPITLVQPRDGTHWGTVVGTCVGQSYEIALIKSKRNNAKCNNPNNWR